MIPDDFELVRRDAESMKVFADGDKTIKFGAWKEWRNACMIAGRTIPPNEFKGQRNDSNRHPA